jgi:hypothetical protein
VNRLEFLGENESPRNHKTRHKVTGSGNSGGLNLANPFHLKRPQVSRQKHRFCRRERLRRIPALS